MKLRTLFLFVLLICLTASLCSCSLLGFNPEESETVSVSQDVSKVNPNEVSSVVNVGEDLDWPKSNLLANYIPEFETGRTIEITESDFYVRFKIADIDKKDYNDYVSKLIKAGYDEVVYTAETLFSAKKNTNNQLGVVIYFSDGTITLEIAKEMPLEESDSSSSETSNEDTSVTDESNNSEISDDNSLSDESFDESIDESMLPETSEDVSLENEQE